MVSGLGNPNNNNFYLALYGQRQQRPDGLFLQQPPKAKQSQKAFGEIVDGEIVAENTNSKSEPKNNSTNKSQTETLSAYANSVRESIRGRDQVISRSDMRDLDQPITQRQYAQLNKRLSGIEQELSKLNTLLGSKSAMNAPEMRNLRNSTMIDNLYGNSELGLG